MDFSRWRANACFRRTLIQWLQPQEMCSKCTPIQDGSVLHTSHVWEEGVPNSAACPAPNRWPGTDRTVLNVLQVIPSIAAVHGGPSLALLSIEKALAARGCSVTTVTTDDAGPGHRLAGDVVSVPLPGVERVYFRKLTEFYKVAPGMGPWLWRNVRRFDIVHVHALFSFSSTAAAMTARHLGVPYVVRPLGTLAAYGVTRRRPWLKRVSLARLEGPALRGAAAVHFTSSSEEQDARLLGIAMKGVVIPLGIESVLGGDRNRTLSELGIPAAAPRILALSRIDPKKNFEGLVRALAILRHEGLAPTLFVGGAGGERLCRRSPRPGPT